MTEFDPLTLMTDEARLLCEKLNSLNGDVKSYQIDLGKKLLEIRRELCKKNGENYFSDRDILGELPPNGWGHWLNENLGLSTTYAMSCIKDAVDPNRILRRKAYQRSHSRPAAGIVASIKRSWPELCDDDRQRIIDCVVELANAS